MPAKTRAESEAAADVGSLHQAFAAVAGEFKNLMAMMSALEEHMAGRSPATRVDLRVWHCMLSVTRMMERLIEMQLLAQGE